MEGYYGLLSAKWGDYHQVPNGTIHFFMPNEETKIIMPIGATSGSWFSCISYIICISWNFTFIPFICMWIFISYVEKFYYPIYSMFYVYMIVSWGLGIMTPFTNILGTQEDAQNFDGWCLSANGGKHYGFLSSILK